MDEKVIILRHINTGITGIFVERRIDCIEGPISLTHIVIRVLNGELFSAPSNEFVEIYNHF